MAYIKLELIKYDPYRETLVGEGYCSLCGALNQITELPEAYQGEIIKNPEIRCQDCGTVLHFEEGLLEILKNESRSVDYDVCLTLSRAQLEKWQSKKEDSQ